MNIKEFDYLPEEAIYIRKEVFVKEQCYSEEEEFDDTDKIANHFIMYDEENPVATCRIFYDEEREAYIIGRVAVLKEKRGLNIGTDLIKEAIKSISNKGIKNVMLSGQVRVQEFYEKLKFHAVGNPYLDEEQVPHIWMKLTLK